MSMLSTAMDSVPLFPTLSECPLTICRDLAAAALAQAETMAPAMMGGKKRVDANDEGALAAARAAVDKVNQENHSLWRHVLVGIDRGEFANGC